MNYLKVFICFRQNVDDFHLSPETHPFYPKKAKDAHREQVLGPFFVDFVIILGPRDIFRFQWKIWEDNLGECVWQNVRLCDTQIYLSLRAVLRRFRDSTPDLRFSGLRKSRNQISTPDFGGLPHFLDPPTFLGNPGRPPQKSKTPKMSKNPS